MTQPISAPPADPDDYVQGPDPRDRAYVPPEIVQEEVVRGLAHVPVVREIMVFSNRFNYQHYYRVPVQVGMQNVPAMVTEMMREGCKITDIQITFDAQEVQS